MQCSLHTHPTQVCEIIDQHCDVDKLQSHMCGLAVIRYIHQMFASRHTVRASCKGMQNILNLNVAMIIILHCMGSYTT